MLTTGAYEKAKLYVQSQEKKAGSNKIKHGVCITISRESGAGADKVSQHLSELFRERQTIDTPDWTVFDKNIIEKMLDDNKLPKRLGKILEEDKISVVSSLMSEWLSGNPPVWNLIHKTTHTILQLAINGNVIIIGRGANIITRKLQNVFHVRLVSTLEFRINHIMELYNLNSKVALEYLKREDSSREKYLLTAFGKNIEDNLFYDLIINTKSFGFKNTAEIIENAVINKFPAFFVE